MAWRYDWRDFQGGIMFMALFQFGVDNVLHWTVRRFLDEVLNLRAALDLPIDSVWIDDDPPEAPPTP